MSSIIDAIKRKKPGCLQNAPPLYERKRGVFIFIVQITLQAHQSQSEQDL